MPNFSLLAIPVYYYTALYPHVVATGILTKHQKEAKAKANDEKAKLPLWDNISPRGSTIQSRIHDVLPPVAAAKYDRAKAAHQNGLENFPLFVAAVLAGNYAGLSYSSKLPLGSQPSFVESLLGGGFEKTLLAILAVRLVYNWAYLNTPETGAEGAQGKSERVTARKIAGLRSLMWAASSFASVGIIICAGLA